MAIILDHEIRVFHKLKFLKYRTICLKLGHGSVRIQKEKNGYDPKGKD